MSTEKQAAVGAGGKEFCLTRREKQITVLVVAGHTDKDIARELGVGEQTIRHHIASISDKLGVSNRLELLLFALHHRLIDCVQKVHQYHQTSHELDYPYVLDVESFMSRPMQKGFTGV
jgi:DNA-binding CsgD family transcriptional regulator